MNINNVSFGKIIKVNAPYASATEIALIANGHDAFVSDSLKKQVREIFPDKDDKVFAYADVNRKAYLFSGEEGKDYERLCSKTADSVRKIRAHFGNTDYADYYSNKACDECDKEVEKIIKGAKEIPEINVCTEKGSSEIKSINIIA